MTDIKVKSWRWLPWWGVEMAERILTREQRGRIENGLPEDAKYSEVIEAWLREQRKMALREVGEWLSDHATTTVVMSQGHGDSIYGEYTFARPSFDKFLLNLYQGKLE